MDKTILEEFDEVVAKLPREEFAKLLPKYPEWISVKDRLPPQKVYVLCAHFDNREKVKMFFIEIAERIGDYWYEGNDGEEITRGGKYGYVTHWMPLPDAPKE